MHTDPAGLSWFPQGSWTQVKSPLEGPATAGEVEMGLSRGKGPSGMAFSREESHRTFQDLRGDRWCLCVCWGEARGREVWGASVTCCLLRVPVTQNSCPSMTCPCCGQEPSGLSCDLWPWGKAAGHIQASPGVHSAWLRPGSPCGQVPAPRSLPVSPTDRVRTSLHVNICLRNWYLHPSSSKCPPARENAGLLFTCCMCCVTSHPTQRACTRIWSQLAGHPGTGGLGRTHQRQQRACSPLDSKATGCMTYPQQAGLAAAHILR